MTEMQRGEVVARRFWVKECVQIRGGAAEYVAVDLRDSTSVRLRTYSNVTSRGVEYFEHIVPRLASLETTFVERVRDFGETETGDLYAASSILPGRRLDRQLAQGINPLRRGLIARRAIEAIAGLHALEIQHGAVNARNLLIADDDQASVGLAGVTLVPPSQIAVDASIPSLQTEDAASIAPEVLRGQSGPFGATDVFALGTLLYELLGGVHPFAANTVVATYLRLLYDEPAHFEPDPSCAALVAPVRRMLDKSPHTRPSMRSLLKWSKSQTDGDDVEAPTLAGRTSVGLVLWERPFVAMSTLHAEDDTEALERRLGASVVRVTSDGRSLMIAELPSDGATSPVVRAAHTAFMLQREHRDAAFVVSSGGQAGIREASELLTRAPRGMVVIPRNQLGLVHADFETQEIGGVVTIWERQAPHPSALVSLSTMEIDTSDVVVIAEAANLDPLPTLEMERPEFAAEITVTDLHASSGKLSAR